MVFRSTTSRATPAIGGLSDEARAAFHERLQDEWPFSLSGKFTNKLPINEETIDRGYEVLEFIWGEVEKMMAEAHQDTDSS